MFAAIAALFGGVAKFLGFNPIQKIFDLVDKNIAAQADQERLKTQLAEQYLTAQTKILTGRGWWFPLLFMIPVGFWFAAVCIYSVLWCQGCAFPQHWTIAALPAPLDNWAGIIVTSMFVGGAGEGIVRVVRALK